MSDAERPASGTVPGPVPDHAASGQRHEPWRAGRLLRYAAPNLFTAVNLLFGMLSLLATYEGRFVDAAWLIIYAVLTDRIDGFVARLVRGTSEFGVQLDSFADFLNFGLAPAVLFHFSLRGEPALPFATGEGQALLMVACAAWILAATFRLARYNISSEVPGAAKIFFGVPTTLAAGLLVSWYLALVKYSATGTPLAPAGAFGGGRLFGDLATPTWVWRYFPLVLLVGAYLMASSLRMPKLGLMRSRAGTVFVMGNVLLGYICGFARVYPEYIVWPPTLWLLVFLAWGQLSPAARAIRPAPIFPVSDPPGRPPMRPEDDLLPDDTHPELPPPNLPGRAGPQH